MNYLAKKIKKRYEDIVPKVRQTKESHKAVINEIKAKNSGGVEESKSDEPQKAIEDKDIKDKANKIISLMAKGTSKGRLEKKKRESIDTSDAKTVIVDTNPQIETYKTNFNSFKELLSKYEKLPDSASYTDFSDEDIVKMKGFIKTLGIPMQTKKLDKLRKKIKINI